MFFDRFAKLTPNRPLILGHRGSPQRAPENSLASFRLALDADADGIELDVHCTADGVLVAHHDDALPSGEVIALCAYAELHPKAAATGYELPTVADVFRLAAGRVLLNIELKHAGYEERVVRLARELLPPERHAYSSFVPEAVAACRKLDPGSPAFIIIAGPCNLDDTVALLKSIDASGVACECRELTERTVQFFLSRRYPVFAWTVNEPAEARRLAALKVTGLITDMPETLVTLFNQSPA